MLDKRRSLFKEFEAIRSRLNELYLDAKERRVLLRGGETFYNLIFISGINHFLQGQLGPLPFPPHTFSVRIVYFILPLVYCGSWYSRLRRIPPVVRVWYAFFP